MRIFTRKSKQNYWIDQNKIPLGYVGDDPEKVIYKRLTNLSDSFFFFARPGVGKSVMLKSLYFFLWLSGRPIIIFDPTGMDHRLSFKENSRPENLPYATEKMGIAKHPFDPDKKVMYLNTSEYHYPWEQRYIPRLVDLGFHELLSLGFSEGACVEIKRILEDYSPFEDYDVLIDFIQKFPVRDGQAVSYRKKYDRGLGKNITSHHTFYKDGAWLNSQTKNNLVRSLYKVKEEGILSLHEEKDFDFLQWIKDGNSIVFSFNRSYEITRIVVSRISRQILTWKSRGGGRGIQPWLIFEEMDRVFPENADPKEKDVVDFLSELILQLRKTSVGIAGSCASLIRTNKNIIENAHNIIFGQIKGRNLTQIANFYNPATANRVKNLYWNRYANNLRGEREFLYIDEFGQQFKIKPFQAPCEIHRESGGRFKPKKK